MVFFLCCLPLLFPSSVTKEFVRKTPIKRKVGSSDTVDTPNGNGNTLLEYCDAIKAVCRYYSIPVCDMYSECAITPFVDVQLNTMFQLGITITNAGSGYTAGAYTVDNTGTGGSGLAGNVAVDGSGAITAVSVTSYGSGYRTMPTITPPGGGSNAVLTPAAIGTHPNLTGQAVMAKRLIAFIRQMIGY